MHSGQTWRYEKFTGRIGKSDIAGTAAVVTGDKRPVLKAAAIRADRLSLENLETHLSLKDSILTLDP